MSDQPKDLDDLLDRARGELESLPTAFVCRLEAQLRQADRCRNRRRRVAVTFAMLCLCAMALCTFLRLDMKTPRQHLGHETKGERELDARPNTASDEPSTRDKATHAASVQPKTGVEVNFHGSTDLIAMPMETESRSVTLFFVYPAVNHDPSGDASPIPHDE